MYKEQAGDKKVFFSRTPDSIVEEIHWLQKSETIKTVAFVDDVFTIKKERVKNILRQMIDQSLDMDWKCEARTDHFDEEIFSNYFFDILHGRFQ